jgi:hypothetical protein
MDIQQAQEEKRLLERAIKKAMDDFSVKTGLPVDSIQVSSTPICGPEALDVVQRKFVRPRYFNHGICLEVKL